MIIFVSRPKKECEYFQNVKFLSPVQMHASTHASTHMSTVVGINVGTNASTTNLQATSSQNLTRDLTSLI